MRKIICLRDDDTNFYTKYQELEEGYGEFWGQIPVTLATIPFVHGSERKIIDTGTFDYLRKWEKSATVKELNEYYRVHPIGANEELVNGLKPLIKKKMIEIAQHGVEHRYNEFGPEMYRDNVSMETIRAGKEYLNKVFDTQVKVFIPPSNTIDPACARYINKMGLDLLTCGSLHYRTKFERLLTTCMYPQDIFRTVNCRIHELHPPVRKRKGINIYSAVTFNQHDVVEDMYEKIICFLNQSGMVGITTHYRLLGELDNSDIDYRRKWHRLISMLNNTENVEFVTASKYIECIKEKYL